MKVFVTGATGELGRPTVRELVRRGHAVRGVTRTRDKAALLRSLGAQPVEMDLHDATAVKAAVVGSDAVLHLATKIPPVARMRSRRAWAENDRLRTEVTRVLVDAALDAGVGTFVLESITFTYPDRGAEWIDEDAPPDGETMWLRSMLDAEASVGHFTDAGRNGIVLRLASFYGPTARSTDEQLRLARRRVAPVLGRPDAYLSSIHTDDAGTAVAATVALPAGVYNVTDDEPLTRRQYADALAAAFGLGRPRILPGWMVRAVAGPAAAIMTRSQRVANRRFKTATGWEPRFASARDGWAAVASTRSGEGSGPQGSGPQGSDPKVSGKEWAKGGDGA